ncbi:hypothetical protein [Nocardia asteroides]|uniref:hypothetical protein n=1 Tax=Nocardia asteroides TaxID=1824 RepID=UPI0033C91465
MVELSEARLAEDLLRSAVSALRDRLPVTWSVTVQREPKRQDGLRPDAYLSVCAPGGPEAIFVVEVKSSITPRFVPALREQLGRLRHGLPGSVGMAVAPYLAEPTRNHLVEAGLSYLDATGNMLVRADEIGLFISDRGAQADPRRGPGRPKEGLKGEPAAKVVRALVDIRGPWQIRNLIAESRASTGSVYRVLEYLDEEALITRQNRRIYVTDWQEILRRWSTDYRFLHTNRVSRWIAPRGLPALAERLRSTEVDYALTGSLAASAWSQYAPVKSAMLYTSEAAVAAEQWGLRETDTGANVLIAEPAYAVAQQRCRRELDGLVVAAPAQVVADLMSGPGRAPAEAEELLDWMGRNESAWRKPQLEPVRFATPDTHSTS